MSVNSKRQSLFQVLNNNGSIEEPQKESLEERDQILVDFKETFLLYNLNELSKSKCALKIYN